MLERLPHSGPDAYGGNFSHSAALAHYPMPDMRGDRLAPELQRLIEKEPMCPVRTNFGDQAWLASGYQLTRQVLEDPRLSLVRTARPGVPQQDFSGIPFWFTGFRGLCRQAGLLPEVLRALGPAHTEVTADWLHGTASALLADLERHGPPADLCSHFAVPLASRTACRLLGIPEQDAPLLADCVSRDLVLKAPADNPFLEDVVLDAEHDIHEVLLYRMRHDRTETPGLLARLARINDQRRRLTDRHLARLVYALVVGAVGNPMAFLGTACLLLLQRRDVCRSLSADPGLIPRAVEEILRRVVFFGDAVARVARHPTTIGDVTVGRNELVLVNIDTACFDPSVFPDPERLDLSRAPGPQPRFGYGPNRCPGSHLARIQARAALRALLPYLTRLRLAVPSEHIPHEPHTAILRPTALPVTW